jgi:hypothetical protein
VVKNSTTVESSYKLSVHPSLAPLQSIWREVLKCRQNTRCRQTTIANGKSEDEENKYVMKNKKVVKQKNTTHSVLGFALLSTLFWRYGVVRIRARFMDKLSNTLSFFRGWVTDGCKNNNYEMKRTHCIDGSLKP